MSTTTPLPPSTSATKHSTSNPRSTSTTIPSRPTTPLRPSSRPSSRTSLHESRNSTTPLETFEPAFAEFSDSMADLEANLMHLQLMHESLARFSENFAGFLFGLNMNAFCVDFPEAPILDSFRRAAEAEGDLGRSTNSERFRGEIDGETTFMTTDTSFVENPPTSSKATPKATPKFSTPAPASRGANVGRGGIPSARGGTARGGARGTRGSGLARAAKGRVVR